MPDDCRILYDNLMFYARIGDAVQHERYAIEYSLCMGSHMYYDGKWDPPGVVRLPCPGGHVGYLRLTAEGLSFSSFNDGKAEADCRKYAGGFPKGQQERLQRRFQCAAPCTMHVRVDFDHVFRTMEDIRHADNKGYAGKTIQCECKPTRGKVKGGTDWFSWEFDCTGLSGSSRWLAEDPPPLLWYEVKCIRPSQPR